MTEGFFRVYRLAEAPQEYCDLAHLGRDDDPIVVVEKDANTKLQLYAGITLSHLLAHVWLSEAGSYGGIPDINTHETPTHIIYTVDRG